MAAMWSHACNSHAQLVEALHNGDITMIEADVMFSADRTKIIMSHPPHRDSDLGLSDFLHAVAAHNQLILTQPNKHGKGVKLDFKDPDVVLPSVDIIREHWKG